MIPYSTQHITEQDLAAIREVMTSGWLTQGPAVPRFEADFAARHGGGHAVATSNATAALHIACLALGVGPGSRVWTSANSFVASSNCALYCGASVDFVDIDARTRNLSLPVLEEKLRAAEKNGTLPDVVIPVAFSGLPCDLAEIRVLANRYGFRILDDASHAVGASYRGKPLSSEYTDASVFSFHPVKIITTGEGGLLSTRDAALAEKLRLLRSHGITREAAQMTAPPEGPWYYEQVDLGFNYRMTDIHAALGSSQITRLDAMHARRKQLASRYGELLAGLPLQLPVTLPDRDSAWHLYVVTLDPARCKVSRKEAFEALRSRRIGVNVHYIPIHLQPYYRKLGFRPGQFPEAERYYAHALTIPLFPQMTDAQQDEVVRALTEVLRA